MCSPQSLRTSHQAGKGRGSTCTLLQPISKPHITQLRERARPGWGLPCKMALDMGVRSASDEVEGLDCGVLGSKTAGVFGSASGCKQ